MTTAAALAALLTLLVPLAALDTQRARGASGPILELRAYNLKPGTRERFHQRFVRDALPLLREWKIDVVAAGPSLHDADSYFLMRAFPSVVERARLEDAFYASPAWRNGPREAVLADIQSYTTIVIPADPELLVRLRALIGSAAPGGPGQEATWRSVARRTQSPSP
jgi:hypothetical protein